MISSSSSFDDYHVQPQQSRINQSTFNGKKESESLSCWSSFECEREIVRSLFDKLDDERASCKCLFCLDHHLKHLEVKGILLGITEYTRLGWRGV